MYIQHLVPAALLLSCTTSTPRSVPRDSGVNARIIELDGTPVAGAVVQVVSVHTGVVVQTLVSSRTGSVFLESTTPSLAITVASRDGYAWVPDSTSLAHSDAIVLNRTCVPTSGRVRHHAESAFVELTRLSSESGDVFGASVDSAGMFAVCLPEATYVGVVAGDEVSLPARFTPPHDHAELTAYSIAAIRSAPATSVSLDEMSKDLIAARARRARVIGLGEANHGTREFLRERISLFLYLAKAGVTRTLALEAGAGEVAALDDYIHGASLDPRRAVAELDYWMWDTEEFVEVLAELREHNMAAEYGSRVSLVGVDVQDAKAAANTLLESTHDLTAHEARLLEIVKSDEGVSAAVLPDHDKQVLDALLERIIKRGAGATHQSPETRQWLAAASIVERLKIVPLQGAPRILQRDRGIADMVLMALSVVGSDRMTILAHNDHLAKDPYFSFDSAGTHLAKSLADEYLAIGYYSMEGDARAWDTAGEIGVVPQNLKSPPRHSVESVIGNASTDDIVYVDLSSAPEPLVDWLRLPRYTRTFGSRYPGHDAAWVLTPVLSSFDIISLSRRSTSSTPTETGIRRAE